MNFTKNTEAPDILHFVTGISTLATVLRRRVWIDERIFIWRPNLYIVMVGPPGVVQKTTTLNIGMSLAVEIDAINFGSEVTTWQSMITDLADSVELVELPGQDHIDPTFREREPMSCVTYALGELGTLYTPDDPRQVDVLTSLWDGKEGVWRKSTKTQGRDNIENPWINIIGCTTPAWMQKNFPAYLIGSGLTSRTIFVFANKKKRLIPYPSEVIEHETFNQQREDLIADLKCISAMFGEYKRTPEATAWGKEWYDSYWETTSAVGFGTRLDTDKSRTQTHIHKLAMIFAAAKRDELIIEKEDLVEAERFLRAVETHKATVFRFIGASSESQNVYEILAMVNARKEITEEALWRECLPMMRRQEFEDALKAATLAGWIARVPVTRDGMPILAIQLREKAAEALAQADGTYDLL